MFLILLPLCVLINYKENLQKTTKITVLKEEQNIKLFEKHIMKSHLSTSLPETHDNCNCHIKSDVDNNFLENHPHLIESIRNILKDLFEKPIRSANDTGSGLVVVPESCYGNQECMNILRPVYIKQFFGMEDHTKPQINGICYRFSYGTGKGKNTSGVGDQ